jgi:acyl dehydratase
MVDVHSRPVPALFKRPRAVAEEIPFDPLPAPRMLCFLLIQVEQISASGLDFPGEQTIPPHQGAALQERRRRMAGLYFEEFEEGQIFEHAIRRTVTEMDNVLFSTLTMNPQPLHLDEEFAKQTEFGQRLVNSLFTLGLVIGITVGETTLGTTIANLGMSDVRFPKPVFHGDTLRARTIVRSKRRSQSRKDAGIVEFEHQGINQRGEIVAICQRAGLMKCRSTEG